MASTSGLADLIKLDELSERSILENLKKRYEANHIYTYAGTILIALNPYQGLPDLYTTSLARSYRRRRIGELPPHVFALADAAHNDMMDSGKRQSIILSGESGSGKTETSKVVLSYLSLLKTGDDQVQRMVLESSPLLEAFGNAKTLRNSNSSRFGKYMEIQFDKEGQIIGANITQYLLEKNRITFRAQNERSYHIFYHMMDGLPSQSKREFGLKSIESYHYLSHSKCTTIDGLNDAEMFSYVVEALTCLGVESKQQDLLWKILSAILHLGNVTITTQKGGTKITNMDALNWVGKLLEVDPGRLEEAILFKSAIVRGEALSISLKEEEALDNRDALAKMIYQRLFEWLVEHINSKMNSPQVEGVIGVLDIFGFEKFEVNSFEQFCINYTNERLQQHFVEHIFKIEQEEYREEGIDWRDISYVDNSALLCLIEKKLGIFSLLDEESRFPSGTDISFLNKINAHHQDDPSYEIPKMSGTTFVIKHYAGDVAYECSGFLSKNRDTLQPQLVDVVRQSRNTFISNKLFPRSHSQKTKSTLSSQCRKSLTDLMVSLRSTTPYFVRCMKPNNNSQHCGFDEETVLRQLASVGMLETISIRQSGFPFRLSFADFVKRYRVVSCEVTGDTREDVERILSKVSIPSKDCVLGKRKIFLRQITQLDNLRTLSEASVAIQKTWRMYVFRLDFLMMRSQIVTSQSVWRMRSERKKFLEKRKAAVILQSLSRKLLAQRIFIEEKKRKEEERKRRNEERKRLEEERKRLEAERKKREEEKRMREEETRQREEERLARERQEEELLKEEEDRIRREEEALENELMLEEARTLTARRKQEEERLRKLEEWEEDLRRREESLASPTVPKNVAFKPLKSALKMPSNAKETERETVKPKVEKVTSKMSPTPTNETHTANVNTLPLPRPHPSKDSQKGKREVPLSLRKREPVPPAAQADSSESSKEKPQRSLSGSKLPIPRAKIKLQRSQRTFDVRQAAESAGSIRVTPESPSMRRTSSIFLKQPDPDMIFRRWSRVWHTPMGENLQRKPSKAELKMERKASVREKKREKEERKEREAQEKKREKERKELEKKMKKGKLSRAASVDITSPPPVPDNQIRKSSTVDVPRRVNFGDQLLPLSESRRSLTRDSRASGTRDIMALIRSQDIQILSPAEEMEIIDTILESDSPKADDLYYLIHAKWWQRWRSYLQENKNLKENFQGVRPGSIDNSPLLAPKENGELHTADDTHQLRPNLRSHEYQIVPKAAWTKLIGWYGGGPPIERKVTIRGMIEQVLHVELYPVHILVHRVDNDSQKRFDFSSTTTMVQVRRVVASKWSVAPRQCRIFMYKTNLTEEENLRKTLDELGVQNRQTLLLRASEDFLVRSGRMGLSEADLGNPSTNEEGTPPVKGVTGLHNLGNTSFMNCILQCLVNTKVLLEFFTSDSYEKEINRNNPLGMKGELAEKFAKMLQDVWSGSFTIVTPVEFRASFLKYAPQFAGMGYYDPIEFLNDALSGLHEDLKRVVLNVNVEHSRVIDWFQGTSTTKLVCSTCAHTMSTLDPFTYLSVPIPNKNDRTIFVTVSKFSNPEKTYTRYGVRVPIDGTVEDLRKAIMRVSQCERIQIVELYHQREFTLKDESEMQSIGVDDVLYAYELDEQGNTPVKVKKPKIVTHPTVQRSQVEVPTTLADCVKEYTSRQILKGDDRWYCPKCQDMVDATKRVKLGTLPEVLVVSIERFHEMEMYFEKIRSRVEFPLLWDTSEYGGENYNLYAMTLHVGDTTTGHFVSVIKSRSDDKWYQYEDDKVTLVEEDLVTDKVHQENVYQLFYRRNPLATPSEKPRLARTLSRTTSLSKFSAARSNLKVATLRKKGKSKEI